MRSYIRADLIRVYKRIPRIIALAVIIVASSYLGTVIAKLFSDGPVNLASAVDNGMSFLSSLAGMAIGLVEIIFVYGDDLKAKTMQIAIGTGLPRQKVVHAKWLEFMIVAATDIVAYAVICIAVCIAVMGTQGGVDIGNVLVNMFMGWLSTVAYLGLTMFLLFATQNTTFPVIVYILVNLGIVSMGLSYLVYLLKLTEYELDKYILSNMLTALKTDMLQGKFSWFNAAGILVYMMVSFALTSIVFRKKELEF